jgi:hypothetical protein
VGLGVGGGVEQLGGWGGGFFGSLAPSLRWNLAAVNYCVS